MEIVVQRLGNWTVRFFVVPCLTGLVLLSVLAAKGFGMVKTWCGQVKKGGN